MCCPNTYVVECRVECRVILTARTRAIIRVKINCRAWDWCTSIVDDGYKTVILVVGFTPLRHQACLLQASLIASDVELPSVKATGISGSSIGDPPSRMTLVGSMVRYRRPNA